MSIRNFESPAIRGTLRIVMEEYDGLRTDLLESVGWRGDTAKTQRTSFLHIGV